jgi:hypothetical protein
MEFLWGFVAGGVVTGFAAYFYGHKAGLALQRATTSIVAAKNDLKKGL